MSGGDRLARAALRERLEWLRDLGVDAVRRPVPARGADAPSAPPTAARSRAADDAPAAGPDSTTQGTGPAALSLFEADPPPRTGAPRKGRAVGAASPLLSLGEPMAAPAAAALQALREEIGADCRRCRLCEKRTQVVFGVGDPGARLMFVGEGPGADEDAQGEPFVGRAGQLLNKIIEAIGLRREQVYIANVVKCRPPENRTPLPDEVATCSPFLLRQIAAIRPRVIVCLGTPAAQSILGTRETITRLRGTFHDLGGIRVMPTFHPAYLLRNPAAKREVWEDMKQVLAALSEA
jgi:DNA polymerase